MSLQTEVPTYEETRKVLRHIFSVKPSTLNHAFVQLVAGIQHAEITADLVNLAKALKEYQDAVEDCGCF